MKFHIHLWKKMEYKGIKYRVCRCGKLQSEKHIDYNLDMSGVPFGKPEIRRNWGDQWRNTTFQEIKIMSILKKRDKEENEKYRSNKKKSIDEINQEILKED